MGVLPRVISVDPTGIVARLVRAALDLTDQSAVHIEVPTSADALEETTHVECQLLISALQLHEQNVNGIDLALKVKETHPNAAVVVVGEGNDPAELDEETRANAPFIYLHRPLDGAQFLRILTAGLEGGDIFTASVPPVRHVESGANLGPIPALDVKVAERVIDSLLIDVGAMAIVLANRSGAVVTERGAVGYLDREQLTSALLPMVTATHDMGQLVGGNQPSALQFYDGDRYDIFVLSVGFHHFMCLVFDGTIGNRQFGAVNRFGRRAAEDLIAVLGIQAFTVPEPVPETEKTQRFRVRIQEKPAPPPEPAPLEPLIVRAEEFVSPAPEPTPEPEPMLLEPIENLDLSLFDNSALGDLDLDAADDLFDPDKLAEIANETRRDHGPLSYEEARELGIIP